MQAAGKLIGLVIGAMDWFVDFAGDVIIPSIFAGVTGVLAGLIFGVALQTILHAFGVAPSVSATGGTDWYGVVPMLLGAGAGLALGARATLEDRRRQREEFERLIHPTDAP